MTAPFWNQGWYRFAHRIDSPNFGPRPQGMDVDLVVIHAISLPPGEYGSSDVPDFFTNQLAHDKHPYFDHLRGVEVSAHFFIRRGGELMQFVSCDERAWHAGESQHAGRANCNDFSIGIELEGDGDTPFEAAQYQALTNLIQKLTSSYPDLQFAGHSDIAPERKTDPGIHFDWKKFQKETGISAKKLPFGLDSR